jgi:sirohydrochlorin cobaltochelatase
MTNHSSSLSSAAQPSGIVLFAHGSRDPLWRKPIESVAQQLQQRQPALPVSCAYLELCEPSLPDAVQQMLNAINSIAETPINTGANPSNSIKIRIIPMFLGMGKHAREDLPLMAQQLRLDHPQVQFEVAATVGEDARLTALLADIALG